MKYDYRAYGAELDEQGKLLRMPFVKVIITGTKGSKEMTALVDSGSQFCLANIDFAEYLGISPDMTKGIPIYGVVGTDNRKFAYPADVLVEVKGQAPITLPVYFMETDSFSFVLGQNGFFDNFTVRFKKKAKTFEISPAK